MKNILTKSLRILFIMIVAIAIVPNTLSATTLTKTISNYGTITYQALDIISVYDQQIIGENKLQLGVNLDWHRWSTFIDQPQQRQMAQQINLKLIRIFDFRKISSYGYTNLMPCIRWDENPNSRIWDWTQVDRLVRTIFENGAEPLFCLGWARENIRNYIPPNMAVNPETQLPYPEQYAAYAAEWVKHFKTIALPVRYYQIMNEPFFYFGWSYSQKLEYYAELWATTATAMRAENSQVRLSHDSMTMKMVLDYWLNNGLEVDFLDFHKYDADYTGQYSDSEMFSRAETMRFQTYGSFYGASEARERWFNRRGESLEIINSESNYSSAWEEGTDPKIQHITGAVWLALVLRADIIEGINYNLFFELTSSKSQQESQGTGLGFGMINGDNLQPWFPYYVHSMIGSNIEVGNEILRTQTTNNNIRSLAWLNKGKINILLISKTTESETIKIEGLSTQMNIYWIDNTISYENPSLQHKTSGPNDSIQINGYSVMLLQST